MTIEHIRRNNARALVKEAGSQTRFAARVGIGRQQANHIVGPSKVKVIGSELARRIEQAFDRPVGWMDEAHEFPVHRNGDDVSIGRIDTSAALGRPEFPMLHAATVQQMRVSQEWLAANLGGKSGRHLAVTEVTGDEMAPLLPKGATVLVDQGASSIREPGVYMLGRADGGIWFRHVHRSPDGRYRLRAENKAYPPMSADSMKAAGLVVLGRVVLVLGITRL